MWFQNSGDILFHNYLKLFQVCTYNMYSDQLVITNCGISVKNKSFKYVIFSEYIKFTIV